MEQQATARVAAASAVSKFKHLRWYICALLFFATVINYIDRQVVGAIAPELQKDIGWTEIEYSNIVNAFQIAYALMFLVWGGVIDRIGVKLGFAIAIVIWSLAGMGTALAAGAIGFGIARFALGVGEAANFRLQSKLWRSGFRNANGRLRPGCLMRAPTWARSSPLRRRYCYMKLSAGAAPLSSPAP